MHVHNTIVCLEEKMFALCIALLLACDAQIALGAVIQYLNYTVQNAVPFNGDNTTATDPLCEFISVTQTLECETGSVLDDGDKGPAIISENYKQFLAFSRQSGEAAILEFHLPDFYSGMINIVFHFLNNPSLSIGLPTLSIQTETSDSGTVVLPFSYDDNHDLKPSDAKLRNVTLLISLPIPINNLMITASFKDHNNVNWLLVSEVDFYNESGIRLLGSSVSSVDLGPDELQSSVQFSCTVVNSGSFDWSWEYAGTPLVRGDRNRVWIADATRSSQLELYKLRSTDSGNYSCAVKHQTGSTFYRKTFQLDLKAKLESESSEVTFPAGSVATLVCEAHGYLPGNIEWHRNGQLIQAEGNYSLTKSSGGLTSISDGGDPQDSEVVAVQVRELDESDGGIYVCSIGDLRMNVTLLIGVPSPLTTPTHATETVNCISPNVLLIQILVNALLGVIMIVTNIFLVEFCRRKHSKVSLEEKGCQVSKKTMPRYAGLLQYQGVTRSLEPIHTHHEDKELQPQKAKSLDYLQFMSSNELGSLEMTNGWL